VESSHVDFVNMKQEHETTDPSEGFPTYSTVLSFASMERKQIYSGLFPCQTKLEVQSYCFLIGTTYCFQLLRITIKHSRSALSWYR